MQILTNTNINIILLIEKGSANIQTLTVKIVLLDIPKGEQGSSTKFYHLVGQAITRIFLYRLLFPDMIISEILRLKVGIRSQDWDHLGHNSDKRTKYLHLFPHGAVRKNFGQA